MIPKAQILQFASSYELQPTTVQKDYVVSLRKHLKIKNVAFRDLSIYF